MEFFETGIKVVDLLAPYRRGGKIGLFKVEDLEAGEFVGNGDHVCRRVWRESHQRRESCFRA